MGTRLEIYIENELIANEIIAISKSFGIDAQIMGRVEESNITDVLVKHNNVEHTYRK